MSTKEIQEAIVDNMRRWQKIKNASVAGQDLGRLITGVLQKI